jgi:adenylosuccinate lyase
MPQISPHDTYTSPLAARNASPEMLRLWSPRHKFNTWRRIWLAVAEAQYEVTKDWGIDKDQRAPTVREGSESTEDQSLPHGRGSSGVGASGPLVTKEQVEELRAVVERGITDEELARAAELEADLRHDVMAHVHCLGEQCPKARPIIHLGMTSQDVVCNADLMILHASHKNIEAKIARAILSLGETSAKHTHLATLGFTHYQSAQPTTVGRRIGEWAANLNLVREERFETYLNDWQMFRGFRGATGTQASFLELFNGDAQCVQEFEARAIWLLLGQLRSRADFAETQKLQLYSHRKLLAGDESVGDTERARASKKRIASIESTTYEEYLVCQTDMTVSYNTFDLTGQTYPRVLDTFVLADLASVASVLHKIATDIRLLSNRKELDEPFGDKQIGSSAMPYKRNPMKCERICGLSRFVMNLVGNAYDTAATQWLERTLDDSSNRRLSLPESFLALDGALDLMHTVASGLVVNEAMVRKNLMAELPFLATENILMEAVKLGGDRQDLHERIRVHAQAAGHRVKQEGLDNDLIERLRGDPAFASVHHLLTEDQLLDPMKYVGRAVEQTERFLKEVVEPLREQYGDALEDLGSSDRGV